ncbi:MULTISPECIES: hypothetical protein [Mesorhizobium]|uniref:Uncharacterized protein n=1 Tax=Mesorhizobium shonense TaxID=1209948 RepID=A0ABV2HVI7_9HYPH|nr:MULTISPECIES: hypothetical protein [unclassified Mesorhizobium]
MERAATNYRDGEATGFERISEYATADLGYTIEIERLRSKVGGGDKLVPIALGSPSYSGGKKARGGSSFVMPIR